MKHEALRWHCPFFVNGSGIKVLLRPMLHLLASINADRPVGHWPLMLLRAAKG
ncbi:hypothetical protein N9025_02025 [Synechococcus sp. AH-707-B22]|nr:hypothetical protein [Synechococcus sp. AH-707-B22]